TIKFDRYFVTSPGNQVVVGPPGLPAVPAVATFPEAPAPMAIGRVARTREAEEVGGWGCWGEQSGQGAVYGATALAVAPARHDDRDRYDAGALLLGPGHRGQELVLVAGLPVGEQQLSFWRQGVDDFAAKDAMLAVSGFQVAVAPEGADRDVLRQGLAQVVSPAAEARVEHGNLDSAAAMAGCMPAVSVEPGQALLDGARTGWSRRQNLGFVGNADGQAGR